MDGCWFAVANSVATCCKICCLIYSLETSAISASLIVECDDVKFSSCTNVDSIALSSLFFTAPNSVDFVFKVSKNALIVSYACLR